MDKKKTIKSLKLDEGDSHVFQYKNKIYKISLFSDVYLLERREFGKWVSLDSSKNKAKLIPKVV